MYNCHTHLLVLKNVPERFLPFYLVRILVKNRLTRPMGKLLHALNPFNANDVLDKYCNFLVQGDRAMPSQVFFDLKNYYPPDTKFVILPMDMDYMGAGNVEIKYHEQLAILSGVQKQYPEQLFPFVAVDPRRTDVFDLVKNYIETKNFKGIKLYPPLGFWPFDKRLYPIYEYAEKHQIPITTHCSRGGVFYKGKISGNDLMHPRTGQKLEKTRNKLFTDNYTHPRNFEYVLKDFPKLKIDFAHWGGWDDWDVYKPDDKENWANIIVELILKYENAYTDISYTLANPKFFGIFQSLFSIPGVKQKVLFGSDFYMVDMEVSEKYFSQELPKKIGYEDFTLISETNPQKFLGF